MVPAPAQHQGHESDSATVPDSENSPLSLGGSHVNSSLKNYISQDSWFACDRNSTSNSSGIRRNLLYQEKKEGQPTLRFFFLHRSLNFLFYHFFKEGILERLACISGGKL